MTIFGKTKTKNFISGCLEYYAMLGWIIKEMIRFNPNFDVYRDAAMSAAGILMHRSMQSNGTPHNIPDFKNKTEHGVQSKTQGA